MGYLYGWLIVMVLSFCIAFFAYVVEESCKREYRNGSNENVRNAQIEKGDISCKN